MERSAAQARADNEHRMGVELGAAYSLLWQEVAWIHSKWAEYVELFGTSAARVEVLNEAAPHFCRMVQDTLWESVLLHIRRLTDRPKVMGKATLSLLALPALIDRPATRAKVDAQIAVCLASSEFARDWRNRSIAHKDRELALSTSAQPLASASRASVKQALADLAAVLNCVSVDYLDATSFFDGGPDSGGALELLHVIHDGLNVQRDRHARIKRGDYAAGDFQPPPL